jgi:hypothetical protein
MSKPRFARAVRSVLVCHSLFFDITDCVLKLSVLRFSPRRRKRDSKTETSSITSPQSATFRFIVQIQAEAFPVVQAVQHLRTTVVTVTHSLQAMLIILLDRK